MRLFPDFDDNLRQAFRTETEMFVSDVVFGGSGNLTSLLTGNYTFMNKDLATYYGVSGPTGTDFVKVALDSTKRAGLLTQASLLAANANINQTSPVARGFFLGDYMGVAFGSDGAVQPADFIRRANRSNSPRKRERSSRVKPGL